MKLCYNLQTCMDSPLEKDLELCEKTGFDAVEINFVKARKYLQNHSMEQLEALLSSYSLKTATLNAIFEINFCDKKEWKRVTDEFHFACELSQACGSNKVIVLSNERNHLPKTVTEQEIETNTLETLSRLSALGNPDGIQIGFEPVGTMAVPNLEWAWSIIKKLNLPDVGLVIDDFNLYLWDLLSDVELIREIMPDKISIVHLNDAEKLPFAKLDQTHRCMPGDGRIDTVRYMQNVKDCGYDGYVSIEVLNPKIWSKGPEAVIPEAYAKGMAILQSIN
ncbi:hypothetical protein C818_03767 [Lachnospiraceae bacterium MD308]|nr:hypothetical protein C818_03767 [Lachnospiraceae bacterium MD308]MCI8503469.1 sugar phosphate isomerase/epimerase [Dorea sp.]